MIDENGRTETDWQTYSKELRGLGSQVELLYQAIEEQSRAGVMYEGGNGDIPVLFSRGKGLAEAWENSTLALIARGGFVRTQYDSKASNGLYTSPPSLDCTMSIIVEDPSSEPMIHRSFPGGMEDLEEYRQEVMDGIKDHMVRDPNDPKDTRWEYTYHGRMFDYGVPGLEKSIDQVATMVEDLSKSPITRRSQVISWQPWQDLSIGDPACFQSLWGRILRKNPEFKFYSDEITGAPKLNLNMRFRSRDAYDAAFMNGFAFIHLAEGIAEQISEKIGEEVTLGRFIDQSDSYHVYGRKLEECNQRFVGQVAKRSFEDRTYTRELMQPLFEEAKPMIAMKVQQQDVNQAEKSDK